MGIAGVSLTGPKRLAPDSGVERHLRRSLIEHSFIYGFYL